MDTKNGKPVSFSAIHDQVHTVRPTDLNIRGTLSGGEVMKMLDYLGATVAMCHSERECVTLSVDHMKFSAPAYLGEALRFKIAVNRVWGSSLEIGAKVHAHNMLTGERRHIVSAYFTFVALDTEGRPTHIRPIIPETDEERRRYAEADMRRAKRLAEEKQKNETKQTKGA